MMTTEALTETTITNRQIRALREEAMGHGDWRMADWCSLAFAEHESADSEGGDLIAPSGALTCRTEARRVCADAINAAAALAGS